MRKTGWIDGRDRPVRVGVYERQFAKITDFAFWNGHCWLCGTMSVSDALKTRERSLYPDRPWRGLLK